MKAAIRLRFAAWVVLFAMVSSRESHAQGTGRSTDIDVSVRSAAMGGASNAVFRDGDVNHWGNPALLGYVDGIRYEHGRTQLVPGLATDVIFTTQFTKVGAYGVGLVFGGEPAGPDGVQLEYGTSEGTDENGNPTGTFSSYERVSSWGFGVNLLETLGSLGVLGAGEMRLDRFVDVSAGMNFKSVDIVLGPGGAASTTNHDLGMLARLTPIDGLSADHGPPIRLDLSYGYSVLSQSDNLVSFPNEDIAVPLTRHHRHGGAIGFAAGLHTSSIESPIARSLVDGLMPLVSATWAADHASLGAGDAIDYETSGHGFEIGVANVFAYRWGHYKDLIGAIDGPTHGFRWSIPVGSFGGFLHEEAWFPQARDSDLEDLHRESYAVWVDPLAIVSAINRSRSGNQEASRPSPGRLAAGGHVPRLLLDR